MFSFLNPALLFASSAALIPLLIHLFSRRKLKVVEFSSLKHLSAMQRQQVRRVKIRQWLLLALRTLAILAAALAFARPVARSGYVGSRGGVSAVILFDNSASMSRETNDGPLFEVAKRRAVEIAATFAEGDEVIFAPFSATVEAPSGGTFASPARAREELGALLPARGRGDLLSAIRQAQKLFGRASHANRELFIISDLQASNISDSVARIYGADNERPTAVYAVALADTPARNCGLESLDFSGQLISLGTPFDISVVARNYDGAIKSDLVGSLYIDDQRVAQIDMALAGGESKKFTFTHTLTQGGRRRGRVEISDDDLSSDNVLNFTLNIPDALSILVVDNNAGGEYIELALAPTGEGAAHYLVKRIASSNLGAVTLEYYDVVVLAGIRLPGVVDVTRVSRFVKQGGGLLCVCGPQSTPADISAVRDLIGADMPEPMKINNPDAGYFSLAQIDYSHPALAVFKDVFATGLPTYRFFSIPEMQLDTGTRTLAAFSGGRPALFERSLGQGKAMTMACVLAPSFSDFQTRSVFAPFVVRLCEYLGSDLSRYDYGRLVDETPSLVPPEGRGASEALTVVAPSGERTMVEPILRQIALPRLTETGVYELRDDAGVIELFAVNADPAEGETATITLAALAEKIGTDILDASLDVQLASFLPEKRTGVELWRLCLWIAVLALVAESILASELGKRSPDNND